jgi:hypothetical protein
MKLTTEQLRNTKMEYLIKITNGMTTVTVYDSIYPKYWVSYAQQKDGATHYQMSSFLEDYETPEYVDTLSKIAYSVFQTLI